MIVKDEIGEDLQSKELEKTQLFVRYVLLTEDGDEADSQWLCSRPKGTGRKWYLRETFLAAAHDFWASHPGKAVSYANAFSKIVKVGKKKLEEGYEVELIWVRETYERAVTVVSEQNPMAFIALFSMDQASVS